MSETCGHYSCCHAAEALNHEEEANKLNRFTVKSSEKFAVSLAKGNDILISMLLQSC